MARGFYKQTLAMKLIGDGEIFRAKEKKFSETIVFVPFFFGKKQHLKSHAKFVNELGYDCVLFNLSSNAPFVFTKILMNTKKGWGLKHLWATEVTQILDAIPGEKIIFSFSNPSTSALKAMRDRKHKDIKAWICDGGPFYDLLKCNWNYFIYESAIQGKIQKMAMHAFVRSIWTIQHEKEIEKDIGALPKNFPVLSIRGWQDPLVPLSSIEKAFKPHSQIDLEVLNLPEGKHLDGLKNFPDIYKQRVADFLKHV